ncbi:MAG: hypothetical protein R3D80_20505 [Paracoccaceae bacterium]
MLVTSFAVAMILQVLFQNLISARSQPVAIPDVLAQSVVLGGLVIGVNKIVAILATVVMLVALEVFMTRQKHGIAMRAAAEDFAVARLMGIRANTVISAAFALSGLLAGVAAVLWVSQRASVDPFDGVHAGAGKCLHRRHSWRARIVARRGCGRLPARVHRGLPRCLPAGRVAGVPRPHRPQPRGAGAGRAAQRLDPGRDAEGEEGMTLLGPGDPAPVEWVNEASAAPVLLLCEHAGQAVPARLGGLGLPPGAIDGHIGWDIGAEALARGRGPAGRAAGDPALLAAGDRLQPPARHAAIGADAERRGGGARERAGHAGGTCRAAARDLRPARRGRRGGFRAASPPRCLLDPFVHSQSERSRPAPRTLGFLARSADAAAPQALIAHVSGGREGLVLGFNAPYEIEDETDWFIPRHAEPRGLSHSLIEVRNDQLRDGAGVARWVNHRRRHRRPPGASPMTLTRNVPLDPTQSALLFVDVQNFAAHREGATFAVDLSKEDFRRQIWLVLRRARGPRHSQHAGHPRRRAGRGWRCSTPRSRALTLDGRDRSLDYKITGFHVPKGSPTAR